MSHSLVPKSNNFDLVRLFAALQVALLHSVEHLKAPVHWPVVDAVLSIFPGVPIFFFVSGFLISNSYDRNPSLRDFALNRCLRIYPALIVCFAVSVLSVALTGYFRGIRIEAGQIAVWAAAQVSFAQFYNPQFMRHYGVGVLNGSMWTICVELQFYVLTPVVHRLCARHKSSFAVNILILGMIGVFLAANRGYFSQEFMQRESFAYKLLGVSFVPWFYMFLAGVFVQKNFDVFRGILSGRFAVVLPAYVAFAALAEIYGGMGGGNEIGPLLFAALTATVFTGAFSWDGLSDRLLRRNDISYGVYIYHMPIVNLLLTMGYGGSISGLCLAMFAIVPCALASWTAIERPALALKTHAVYSHAAPKST